MTLGPIARALFGLVACTQRVPFNAACAVLAIAYSTLIFVSVATVPVQALPPLEARSATVPPRSQAATDNAGSQNGTPDVSSHAVGSSQHPGWVGDRNAGLKPRHASPPETRPTVLRNVSLSPSQHPGWIGRSIETRQVERAESGHDRGYTNDDIVTLVLVGDTGFAPSRARVHPKLVRKHGRTLTFEKAMSRIASEIDGDINFANIETVITDRNDLPTRSKKFNFRTHPEGARVLVESGFNLFSLANNHAIDYGRRGAEETLKHVASLRNVGLLGAAGLGGTHDEAASPDIFSLKGQSVAFSSMGIGSGGVYPSRNAGSSAFGQLNINSKDHYNDVVDRLRLSRADYRILSMHYGSELQIRPSSSQIHKWRRETLKAGNIDLILGHHHHVPQGVEMTDGKLIFYGLGNFLHHGTRNMAGLGRCRDWGMLARVHLLPRSQGGFQAEAVEIVPLTDMHVQTRRHSPEQSRRRILALNALAGQLDSKADGSQGLRFKPQKDGRGLFCRFDPDRVLPPQLAALCADYPMGDDAAIARIPKSSCGGTPQRYRSKRIASRSASRSAFRDFRNGSRAKVKRRAKRRSARRRKASRSRRRASRKRARKKQVRKSAAHRRAFQAVR